MKSCERIGMNYDTNMLVVEYFTFETPPKRRIRQMKIPSGSDEPYEVKFLTDELIKRHSDVLSPSLVPYSQLTSLLTQHKAHVFPDDPRRATGYLAAHIQGTGEDEGKQSPPAVDGEPTSVPDSVEGSTMGYSLGESALCCDFYS